MRGKRTPALLTARNVCAAAILLTAAGCATLLYQRLPKPEQKRYFELAAVGLSEELKEYAALPDSAAREQYWKSFWKKKDPTPTTERNERYEEHLARIAFADENFPSANYFWDDRGKIYIKYGDPDEREWYPTGDGPSPNAGDEGLTVNKTVAASRPWERWFYGRYGCTFCFVERDAGYRLVWDLNTAKSAHPGATIYSLKSFEVEKPTLTDEMPGDAYHHDFGQPLDFPFGLSRFGDSLGAEIWIYYSVPLANLSYNDSTGRAQLCRSIVIFNRAMQEAARNDKILTPPDMGKKIANAQAIDVCR
ncbi:MAG: GWxTD domain-containing protein, partial [Candidatus Edwardsbacteria bacterium]|nr:GWxTD domain-containing protein [Candidatus Edwardsbacteria bacterium]